MISRHSVNNAVCITTLFYNKIAFLLTYYILQLIIITSYIVIRIFF